MALSLEHREYLQVCLKIPICSIPVNRRYAHCTFSTRTRTRTLPVTLYANAHIASRYDLLAFLTRHVSERTSICVLVHCVAGRRTVCVAGIICSVHFKTTTRQRYLSKHVAMPRPHRFPSNRPLQPSAQAFVLFVVFFW